MERNEKLTSPSSMQLKWKLSCVEFVQIWPQLTKMKAFTFFLSRQTMSPVDVNGKLSFKYFYQFRSAKVFLCTAVSTMVVLQKHKNVLCTAQGHVMFSIILSLLGLRLTSFPQERKGSTDWVVCLHRGNREPPLYTNTFWHARVC